MTMKKILQLKEIFSSAIYYLAILIFIIGFNFSDTPLSGGWYQQFIPSIGSKQINDITFLDSLTGFAVASKNVNPDTSSILRTTNTGDNWQIVFTQAQRRFSRVKFINSYTGFISGGSGSGTSYLYKTTDGGYNWNTVPGATLGNAYWNDMSVLSNDVLWLADNDPLTGGLFFTSNGGGNWIRQYNNPNSQPEKIYMFNSRIVFISCTNTNYAFLKTTDGGNNWTFIPGVDGFRDIYFADSLTGWEMLPLRRVYEKNNKWRI